MKADFEISTNAEIQAEFERLFLDYDKLVEAVKYADSERALCTANDPKGYGLVTVNAKAARGLREQFCGEHWISDENDNQPGIFNPALKTRIIPCNFDENAGNRLVEPSNRKEKGSASGAKVRCNATGWLPGLDAPITGKADEEISTIILGIYSEEGEPLRAELAYPIGFCSKKYTDFSKRIILLDGTEDFSDLNRSDRGNPTETVEIKISRR